MLKKKKEHPKEKARLHKRSKHRERYDLAELKKSCPELGRFIITNPYGDESIDFFNPEAVKMLNKSLLMHFYGLTYWEIPESYLCPAVPGRADYIHYVAELLKLDKPIEQTQDTTRLIRCLDIGVGANCVYPIIGVAEYNWDFVGCDIDQTAVNSARNIVEANEGLKDKVKIRFQNNPKNILHGIIEKGDYFDAVICNPPFHFSQADAQASTERKLKNLKHKPSVKAVLNFGGQSNELWCKGGEKKFISDLILESKQFPKQCFWYTSLVSDQNNLDPLYHLLEDQEATEIKVIKMGTGNKLSRLICWTFLSPDQQTKWKQRILK